MDTPITDEELVEMAGSIAPGYYLKLGVKLGHKLARLEQILQSKNNDYLRSNVAILMIWRDSPGQGESWRTKRSRLTQIFSSVGIKTLSDTVSSGNVTISMTGAPKNMVIGDQYHTYNHYHGLGGAGGPGAGGGGAGGPGGGGAGGAGAGGAGAGGGGAGGGGAAGAAGGAGGAEGAGGPGAGAAGGAAGGGAGVGGAGGTGGEGGAGGARAFQSSEPLASAAAQSVSIPEPVIGLSDAVLKEIAENLETDEQMESLARALGRTRTQINQCHASNRLTGSVTTRGTVEMLTSWKATVQPEIQMSRMRSAMTSARLLYLRDTVLLKAEKQQEQEKQDYQRQLLVQQQQQQLQHPRQQHQQLEESQSSHQAETHQEISRVESPEGESTFSSLRSVDPRIAVSAGSLEEARGRIVESKQRSAPPCHPEPSTSSTSASYRRQQELCDIYLVYSQETEHVRKVKDIIRSNGWSMITKADRRLGVPKMASIEEALKTCSHVILVITEEDCHENDPHQTMTIEMAFQLKQALDGRVISIRCCEESSLPMSLQSLENVCISDVNLENELKKSIDVRRRKRVEGGPLGISSTQMSTTYPTGDATASSATFDTSNHSLIPSQVASQVEPLISQISQTSSTHTSSSQPTGESMAPPGTFDASSQCLTPSQVALQIEQLIPRINQLSTAPNSLLNIQGNVYNIGSIHYAGSPGAMLPDLMVVPPAVRHELSKRLNGTRVTHDDWRGLACAFKLDSYIDSLSNRPDPTGAVISHAEGQEKLCSLDDLRGILVGMKRDDCVEVLDQHMGGAGELGNRLMITDRDRDGSSSDEF